MSTEPAARLDDDLDRRVRENQRRLTADLKPHYDFVVCGAGSSGSVVARRLAEDPAISDKFDLSANRSRTAHKMLQSILAKAND